MIWNLANLMTLSNLFCGCLAIVFLFNGQPQFIFWCWVLSVVFDFFDGFVARLLNVKSDLGGQLDSLADVVSFGVVPGLLVYHIIGQSLGDPLHWLSFFGFVLVLFSAVRLAKFNLDTRQTDGFLGLPTPSCAAFWVGWFQFWLMNKEVPGHISSSVPLLLFLVVLFCYLLICELPMIALKFSKDMPQAKKNIIILAAIVSIINFFIFGKFALSINVTGYLLYSFASYYLSVKKLKV